MSKTVMKALSNNKDNAKNPERYKYLFETSKHFTTLDTGILVFLGSLKIGILSGKPLNNNSAWFVFAGLIASIFISTLAMFLISIATKNEQPNRATKMLDSYWGTTIIFLGEFVFFVAVLVYLLNASAG
jgi:hypothetical protein